MAIDEKNATRAEQEYREVLQWARTEEHKLIAKLKQEGKWLGGLDSNSAEFTYINQKLKQKIKEIQEKYGISK